MICGDVVATDSFFLNNHIQTLDSHSTIITGGGVIYGYFEGENVVFQGNSIKMDNRNKSNSDSNNSKNNNNNHHHYGFHGESSSSSSNGAITTKGTKGGALYITEYKAVDDHLDSRLNYLTCTSCIFIQNNADHGGAIYMAKVI